ncbi:MAG: hypothetical protein WBM96_07995 [Polyangiales bacterium]
MTTNPQSAPGTKTYSIVIVICTLSVCSGVVRAARVHARSAKKGDEENVDGMVLTLSHAEKVLDYGDSDDAPR